MNVDLRHLCLFQRNKFRFWRSSSPLINPIKAIIGLNTAFEAYFSVLVSQKLNTHTSYLNKAPETYNGELKALKRLAKFLNYSDVLNDFRTAPVEHIPNEPPTREQVLTGFRALKDDLSRAMHIFIATTGLRKSEVLGLKMKDINFDTRAVVPNHYTRTKRSGITFYNEECVPYLHSYLDKRTDDDPRLFVVSYRKWVEKCTEPLK